MIVLTIAGLVLLGWLLGSLVNYLSDVLPETRRFSPALCATCQAPRSLADFLLLRRCSQCHSPRRIRAWVVQILAVIITLLEWFFPSARLGFWVGMLVLTYFGVVAVIDIENRLILHPVSAVGAVIALAVGVWLRGIETTLYGGLAGFGIMFGLYLLGWLVAKGLGKLRGQAIEEDALGFGDIILCAVLGLMLGWPKILGGVVYTIFIAGAFSLLIILYQLIRRRYEAYMAVAFGPYLILAAILLLYSPQL